MNTTTFVFGQLLSLEMLRGTRRQAHKRILPSLNRQERHMDNNLLIIAFLIVGLIANFTVLTVADE